MSTQNIQDRLNEIADKKLKAEVTKALQPYYSLIQSIGYLEVCKVTKQLNQESPNVWAFMGQIENLIIGEKTPAYRNTETTEFLRKVNDLEAQIDELRNSLPN